MKSFHSPQRTPLPGERQAAGGYTPAPMDSVTRAALRAHMIATGMCGDTRTLRENAVSNAVKLAEGDPDKALGIGARDKSAAQIMVAVADLCGCSADIGDTQGPGVIDADRTLDALAAMGARLATAARAREPMLIATGHPTGLMPMYQAVGRALARAGVALATPLQDAPLDDPGRKRARRIRYFDRVAALCDAANVLHTHESWPMDALLDAIERDVGSPALILADHGLAGAAIARGFDVICFTDVNDPAIAVAKADGMVEIVVPLDDNLPPSDYDPLRDYLVTCVG